MNILTKAISGLVVFSTAISANAIVVTQETNADILSGYLSGSGVSISNAQYVGSSRAAGTFTGGSDLGIDSGVVLSSGSASSIEGPNSSTSTTNYNWTSGLSGLTNLSGYQTYDATALTFDFEFDGGNGGDLSFNFVFGSDEYNEWVGSAYNDIFAFYVDGVNQALLPDGTPVAINNVNNGSNSSLYIDNDSGAFDTEMDGFTTVLGFDVFGLGAGLHTLSFQVADASDRAWNSWLLIEEGSFSVASVPELSASSAPLSVMLLAGLLALGVERRKRYKS